MSNLKDNNNKSLVNKANTDNVLLNVPNYYHSSDHEEIVDIGHKAQKLSTAIYMVSDLHSADDPISLASKDASVDVLKNLYKVCRIPDGKRVSLFSDIATTLASLISFLTVMHKNGKISDMNYQLLIREIHSMNDRIDILIKKNLPYDRKKQSSLLVEEFSFSDSFFETNTPKKKETSMYQAHLKDTVNTIKDTHKVTEKQSSKSIDNKDVKQDTAVPAVKVIEGSKGHEIKKAPETKKTSSTDLKATELKEIRHQNILKILKQKKDAKIGDIASLFQDCSRKTIQRDLQELVDQSLVTKEGDRRWSVYNLAY